MINNPYRALGVPDGSSEEICARAYRRLAKKYHPDLNPDDEVAAARMAEINAAFDQIKAMSNATINGHFYENENNEVDFYEIVSKYLNGFQYKQALNVLQQMDERTGQWYYLSAVASYGLRDLDVAEELIEIACSMDQNNTLYQQTRERIKKGFSKYDPTYKRPSERDYESETDTKTKVKRVITMVIIAIVFFAIVMLGFKFMSGLSKNYNGISKDDLPSDSSQIETTVSAEQEAF